MNDSQQNLTPQTPEDVPDEISAEFDELENSTMNSEALSSNPEPSAEMPPNAVLAEQLPSNQRETVLAEVIDQPIAAATISPTPAEKTPPTSENAITSAPSNSVSVSRRENIPSVLIESAPFSWAGKFLFYFTMILVIVAVVIGIFWAKKLLREFQDQRFLRDVQVIQEAFNQYNQGKNEMAPSAIPQEMRESLGGNWRVEKSEKPSGVEVTEIVIENPDRSLAEMEILDKKIDDGDLSTGKFTLKGRDVYSIKVLQMTLPLPEPKKIPLRKSERIEPRPPANAEELDSNYLLKSQ